ncbi:hypothetical protein WOC04_22080 [Vibrio parahaemolyticus]|uniref:hypothetical protein n=1 Tax=Vibrio parahaemolyticus TaxID=670 RepID=UPI0030F25D5D
MNLESFDTETHIRVNWSDRCNLLPLFRLLRHALGTFTFSGVEEKHFWWSAEGMASQLGRGVVSEILAESLATLPSSESYLTLVEIIIGDWQLVDKQFNHEQPEELTKVIETLAKKRDEIRENLREEPYLNASVDVAQGRFSEPVAEWESSAKASQMRLERSQ